MPVLERLYGSSSFSNSLRLVGEDGIRALFGFDSKKEPIFILSGRGLEFWSDVNIEPTIKVHFNDLIYRKEEDVDKAIEAIRELKEKYPVKISRALVLACAPFKDTKTLLSRTRDAATWLGQGAWHVRDVIRRRGGA